MKGLVYCMKHQGNIIYVGSTVDLPARKYDHITHGKQPIHKHVETLPKQWKEIEFEVLQKYDDLIDREELRMYEREWYDVSGCPSYQYVPLLFDFEVEDLARERAKVWREENPDKVEEQRQREPYKEKARQRALEWNKKMKGVKVKCECGAEVVRKGLPQHKKSKIHLNWEMNK